MKKNTAFLLPLLAFATGVLSSCGGGKIEAAKIQFGALYDTTLSGNDIFHPYNNSDVHYTPHSVLQGLVNKKESFVVCVLGSPTCGCWHNFRDNILSRYMKAHNLDVYLIKHEQFDDAEKFGLKVSASNEVIGIFKDGVLLDQHDNVEGSDFASDYSTFAAWMDERVVAPSMLYVSKKQLDELYEGKINGEKAVEEFTIYFSRSSCGDCSYLSKTMLRSYLGETKRQTSFIIECDMEGIRFVNGEGPGSENPNQIAATAQWNSFKEEYGLAEGPNNPGGFGTGYVPTLFHIHANGDGNKTGEDVIDGGAVYFNDSTELANEEYKITSSYYTEERLERVELDYLKNSDVEKKVLKGASLGKYEGEKSGYYSWYQQEAAKLHDPIMKAFLDAYISL
ncbi:MAG: hypothetical protein MJ239_04685 [Bacilli bacterium]|nr:hypothetical protein [Bacilli bacterium]